MKNIPFIKTIFCFLSISVLYMLCAEAYAQNDATTIINSCEKFRTNKRMFTPIMLCMQQVIGNVLDIYLDSTAGQLNNVIISMMQLAIIFLAIRIITGSSSAPAAESFLLIGKILLVSFFVLNMGVREYIGILSALTAAINDTFTTVIFPGGNIDVFVGQGDVVAENPDGGVTYTPANVVPPGGLSMWHRMDFMIFRILGLGEGNTNLLNGFVGVAMIMSGLATLGPVGGWIGIVVTFALFTVFGAFAMAIFTYIVSFIAIMALGAFSPLIIPLVLFDQTRSIFEKWLEQLMSYTLQPVILTVFLVFMFGVMENGIVDTQVQYLDGQETIKGANDKNSVSILNTPLMQKSSQKAGVEERESFDSEASRYVPGVGYIFETVRSQTEGLGNIKIQMPFLAWDQRDTQEFTINMMLNIFLAFIMMSFIHSLPKLVTEIIGDRTIPNLVDQFARPAFGSIMRVQGSFAQRMGG